MAKLTDQERTDLLPGLKGWSLVEGQDAIRKVFVFEDFSEAFGWMTRVAMAAERRGHHPDWSNSHKKVEVVLTTHSAHGLTRKDLELAQDMDRYAAGLTEER